MLTMCLTRLMMCYLTFMMLLFQTRPVVLFNASRSSRQEHALMYVPLSSVLRIYVLLLFSILLLTFFCSQVYVPFCSHVPSHVYVLIMYRFTLLSSHLYQDSPFVLTFLHYRFLAFYIQAYYSSSTLILLSYLIFLLSYLNLRLWFYF